MEATTKRKANHPRYSDTEKYIILKRREQDVPYAEIRKELTKINGGILRPLGSLHAIMSLTLKGKSSSDFENAKPNQEMVIKTSNETKQVVKPAITYKNAYSELKQHTRELLVNHVLDNITDEMKILSLPADNFIFEKQLRDQFSKRNPNGHIDFLCAERNEAVYAKGIGEAMRNNFNYVKADMKDLLPQLSNPFNAIWLDFCCMYNEAVVQCLQTVASNSLLGEHGTLALTLMYGREPNINQLMPFLKNGERVDTDSLRYKAFPRYVSEIIFHGKVKLQRILKYHDLGEGNLAAPMSIYIFHKSDKEFDKKGIIDLKFRPL